MTFRNFNDPLIYLLKQSRNWVFLWRPRKRTKPKLFLLVELYWPVCLSSGLVPLQRKISPGREFPDVKKRFIRKWLIIKYFYDNGGRVFICHSVAFQNDSSALLLFVIKILMLHFKNVLRINSRLRFWKEYNCVFKNCKYNTITYFLSKTYKILPFSIKTER